MVKVTIRRPTKMIIALILCLLSSVSIYLLYLQKVERDYSIMTYEMYSEDKYYYSYEEFVENGYIVDISDDRREENGKPRRNFFEKLAKGKKVVYNRVYKTDKDALAFIHVYYDGNDHFEYVKDTTQHFGYIAELVQATCTSFDGFSLRGCNVKGGTIPFDSLYGRS